ncbi:MAG: YfhO family protein [Candidatus Levybacteria bacterium]|nr:YfhO family protein [Candidatus Levybacteria bacterium]
MKIREFIFAIGIFLFILIFFFYKSFLNGLIPFPADNLITHYSPWKTYSYLGYNPGTYPDKAQYFDTLKQIYPWRTLSIDSLKKGEIPFWNPYNFSGSPILANSQSAVFYPFTILYFFFSQVTAWSLLVMLQPLLAGIFSYLFAREIKMGKYGSIFSAIIFPYSLFMTVFSQYNTIGHVILWLPLSLYFVERLIKKINSWNIIFFIVSLLFSFLAGHIQIFVFSLIFIVIYATTRIIYNDFKNNRRNILLAVFFSLIILFWGISSFQLFPTIELINLSARTSQDYKFLLENLLIQFNQLILFVSPDFFGNPASQNYLLSDSYPGNAMYVGLIPLIFAIFSLFDFKKKYQIKFFLIAFIVLLVFLTRSFLTELLYSVNIPFFSTGSPTNALFLLSFSLSILAGFGIERFIKNEGKLYRVATFIGLLFLFLWIYILAIHSQTSTKNFIYSSLILGTFILLILIAKIFKLNRKFIALIFVIVTVFDLFYFFQKFNPFVPKNLVFPQASIIDYLKKTAGIDRVWGYGGAAIEANFATQFEFFSPDGYDPIYPKRYGEFIQSSKNGKIKKVFINENRSDAIIAPGFGEKDLPSNIYRLRILDILGIKYILDRVENGSTEITFPKERFKLIHETNNWLVLENQKALPRVFLASNYKVFKTDQEFENNFFSENFDPRRTILLEENLAENIDQGSSGQVGLISYNPNKVILNSKTERKQLLFISDVFYPSWKAFVDGKETKIYRANYAFRAIIVPSGKHTVIFSYTPDSFVLGIKVSIISLIALSGFLILIPRLVKNE